MSCRTKQKQVFKDPVIQGCVSKSGPPLVTAYTRFLVNVLLNVSKVIFCCEPLCTILSVIKWRMVFTMAIQGFQKVKASIMWAMSVVTTAHSTQITFFPILSTMKPNTGEAGAEMMYTILGEKKRVERDTEGEEGRRRRKRKGKGEEGRDRETYSYNVLWQFLA